MSRRTARGPSPGGWWLVDDHGRARLQAGSDSKPTTSCCASSEASREDFRPSSRDCRQRVQAAVAGPGKADERLRTQSSAVHLLDVKVPVHSDLRPRAGRHARQHKHEIGFSAGGMSVLYPLLIPAVDRLGIRDALETALDGLADYAHRSPCSPTSSTPRLVDRRLCSCTRASRGLGSLGRSESPELFQ